MIPALLSAVVTTALAPVWPEVATGLRPLVRGTLIGDAAVVVGLARVSPVEHPDLRLDPNWPGTLAFLRAPIQGAGERELYDLRGGGWWRSRGLLTPERWQVANGFVYWANISDGPMGWGPPLKEGQPPRPPVVDIISYPLATDELAVCQVRGLNISRTDLYKRYAAINKIREATPKSRLSEFTDLFDGVFRNHEPLPPAAQWRAHFDFVFDAAGKPELYVIAPYQLFRYRSTLDTSGTRPEYRWTKVGTYTPGWEGPFYAAIDGGNRHFVVPGGRVFTLPADAKPDSELVKTWDKGPILALVHDADTHQSYAFTRTHFFRLTAKPQPKPHAIQAFPGRTSAEALETVVQCARAIRAGR